MRKSKGLKFTYLVIAFICISTLLAIIPMSFGAINNGAVIGAFTSSMNEGAFGIDSNFYTSIDFDNNLMRYLTEITSSSVLDPDEKDSVEGYKYLKDKKITSKEALNEIKNADYFVINKDTKEINTNTKYKTLDEFESNIKGECSVKISVENNNISYTKDISDDKFETPNVNRQLGSVMNISNGDIYISIHKNFDKGSPIWDEIYQAKVEFEQNILYVQIIAVVFLGALVLAIISIILYKRNKSYLFDEESLWLKLSKFVPLELYIGGLFLAVMLILQSITYSFEVFGTFITSFFGIGFIFTVFYIFNRQLNTYDNKLDIFKTSFVYRLFKFIKEIIKNSIKLTRSMPLAKRIILLGGVCIVVIIIGAFMSAIDYDNLFWLLLVSILSICIFTYYVLKKLSYLSYIMDGTQRIKDGDIHYKIDMIGEDNFTTLADNINNIRDGLDKAIDNQLRSERMKSELITNVSHDLKTPLTSIINYIELIKKEEDISPKYLKDYVSVLDAKSKRLKVLIEDLFEASKASSGNIELNMEKIDITQLLRQSIGELEEKLSEASLDLKINVPEEKVYIKADGRRMYRVLENLLSNISKYSMPNTRVYIDIIEVDNKVKLTMKNISSYELNFDPEEIMERFKRADESRNTEGSGLGLAIARDLVKLQGGIFNIDIDGDLFKSVIEFNSIN